MSTLAAHTPQPLPPRAAMSVFIEPTRSPKLLIADDHALLRFGLRSLLAAQHDGGLVFLEASCLSEAHELYVRADGVDLVLLDLNMPDSRGLQGVQSFARRFPAARVAVISATQDSFVVAQAKALGVVAFLCKAQPPQDLARQIMALLPKPNATNEAIQSVASQASANCIAELGPRHLEVLDHILFGCSNQEIAQALGLTVGTVKNYVSAIFMALDVRSRSHLISVFK
jgi:DNA-binding NarL/FixJ family response regulator